MGKGVPARFDGVRCPGADLASSKAGVDFTGYFALIVVQLLMSRSLRFTYYMMG